MRTRRRDEGGATTVELVPVPPLQPPEPGRSRAQAWGARGERGAVAVEAAIVSSVLLVPLLLGVLYYGNYLWKSQQVALLDPNLDQSGFVGEICPGELLARVKDAALVAMENVDDAAGLPLTSNSITTSLVNGVPGQLGVDIRVSITTTITSSAPIPLPNDGNVVNDVMIRLQNVVIKTGC
jgi:Flp pilus assembly protein TadG